MSLNYQNTFLGCFGLWEYFAGLFEPALLKSISFEDHQCDNLFTLTLSVSASPFNDPFDLKSGRTTR